MSISKMAYWKPVEFGSTDGEFQTRRELRFGPTTIEYGWSIISGRWQNMAKLQMLSKILCDVWSLSRIRQNWSGQHTSQMNSAVRLKSWLFRVNFNQPESTWTDLNQLDPRLTRHLLTPDWPCDKSVTSLDHWPCAFGLGLGMLPRRFDAAWWVLRTSKRIQIWS